MTSTCMSVNSTCMSLLLLKNFEVLLVNTSSVYQINSRGYFCLYAIFLINGIVEQFWLKRAFPGGESRAN